MGRQVTLMRISSPKSVKPFCAFYNFIQKPLVEETQNTNVQTKDMECNLHQN